MGDLGATIKKKMLANQWSFLLIVVIILSVIAGTVNSRYFWLGNLSNLLGQISVLSLVACGATILIISGNFDISVGANIGLSSVVMAMLMRTGFSSVSGLGRGGDRNNLRFTYRRSIDFISGSVVYYFTCRNWGFSRNSVIYHPGDNPNDLWTV